VEENLNPETENKPEIPVCRNCDSPNVLHGHPMLLCGDCRTKLINYPIPLWVKLFGAGIGVVLLISMIWLPKNLSAAISLTRAEKAEKRHDYVTGQRELEKAQKIVPNSTDVLEHLMIASYYNNDFATLYDASARLQNKTIEDSAIYEQLTTILNETKQYTPSDTFATAFKQYKDLVVPDTALSRYVKKNPFDIYAVYTLASSYDDKQQYRSADSLLSRLLVIDAEFFPALNLKTRVKREIDQPDSSIFYCDKILALNHQSVYGMSSKARTFLKTGKKQEGLNLAKQCYQLDDKTPYNLATLAIAYHLNNDFKARDAVLTNAKKDTANAYYMNYANDIISNKAKL
jgi:thioredoxin-like negative regulator of GroEL